MSKSAIHPTAVRLYEAAYASRKLAEDEGPAALGRLINASTQQVTNWEVRGVSKEGMLNAQHILGVNATWVEHGTPPMLIPQQYAKSSTVEASFSTARDNLASYNAEWPFSPPLLDRIKALPPRYTDVIEGALRAVLKDCEEEIAADATKRAANGKP